MPFFIPLRIGEFGWEMGEYKDDWSKAAYFYTAACEVYGRDMQDEIRELLAPYDIEVIVEEPPRFGGDEWSYLENGGIDHADECKEMVDYLLNDAEALIRFLFNDDSFVVTSSDNCDDVDYAWYHGKINKAAEGSKIFYKGN